MDISSGDLCVSCHSVDSKFCAYTGRKCEGKGFQAKLHIVITVTRTYYYTVLGTCWRLLDYIRTGSVESREPGWMIPRDSSRRSRQKSCCRPNLLLLGIIAPSRNQIRRVARKLVTSQGPRIKDHRSGARSAVPLLHYTLHIRYGSLPLCLSSPGSFACPSSVSLSSSRSLRGALGTPPPHFDFTSRLPRSFIPNSQTAGAKKSVTAPENIISPPA